MPVIRLILSRGRKSTYLNSLPHLHKCYDHTITAVLPLPNTLATCASLPQELNTTDSDHTDEWHRRRSNGKYPLKLVQEMGLKQALLSRTPPQLLIFADVN